MQATAHNTRGACNRCGKVTAWVMGVAFQGDGTGKFRNLCARCERVEKHINQPSLYAGIAVYERCKTVSYNRQNLHTNTRVSLSLLVVVLLR
jgi:hypothetical protein